VIGERTAQGYTSVWIATCGACWVVGLGSNLFEHEVMRAVDPMPPTFSDALRYFVSFRSGNRNGALELRDIYAGKSLSQPSAGVRHLLHVRSICSGSDVRASDGKAIPGAEISSLPQKRSLEDMSLAGVLTKTETTAPSESASSATLGKGWLSDRPDALLGSTESQSRLQVVKSLVLQVDPGAQVRPIPMDLFGTGADSRSEAFLVVCSSASLGSKVAVALVEARSVPTAGTAGAHSTSSDCDRFEARSMLSLLAEGWGGVVGYPMPKVRQQSLCATGVQRLVGRALDC
jgi:hypothetical protein